MTPKQLKFLRLLTRTGFATNKHIAQMDIVKLKTTNSDVTKRLLEKKYIGRVLVSAGFGTGRKVMYFITKRGAEIVAETDSIDLSELAFTNYTGGIKKAHIDGDVALVRTDFFHKEQYISTFLALEKYLENTDYLLDSFHHYYKLKGLYSTTLEIGKKKFKPDGIFFCTPTDPKKLIYIYVVEIHRHSDRRHIIKQLLKHVEALKSGSMRKRFNIDMPYFILSVFTNENINLIHSVVEELKTFDEWEYIERFFMFAKLEELHNDFYANFHYFGGKKKPLPPISEM